MNPANPSKSSVPENETTLFSNPLSTGESFVNLIKAKDFDTLEQTFLPEVRFRSLVPSGERLGATASEAVGWLRRWFGDKDAIETLSSSIDLVDDTLSIIYRFRVHNNQDGWQIIEQHAYGHLKEGRIADLWLVCSGFHQDPSYLKDPGSSTRQTPRPHFGGTLFYDAGAKGCADGPIDEIARLMRQLEPGQTLEIHATEPSVAGDLPGWCRLSGHEFVNAEADYYLIRHK